MGRNKTGLTANTKNHLILGAGAFFKNFVVGTDTYENAKAKIIGATQGGGEFKAAPTVHNIKIDGILGEAADLDVIDWWEVTLKAGFIEANENVIRAALGASTIDTSDSTYDIIKGDTEFKASDYLENVTFVGTLSGSQTPIIIQVYNAVNMDGLTIKTEDGSEGVIEITFKGKYTSSNPDEAPFAIYYPKLMTVSAQTKTVVHGNTTTVTVTNAVGTLTVGSSNTGVATASVNNSTVTISGVAAGSAVITITDTNGNTAAVDVTVT